MHVFVVSQGERGEGKSPIAVTTRRSLAIKVVESVVPHFGPYKQRRGEPNRWYSGCDEIELQKMTVIENVSQLVLT